MMYNSVKKLFANSNGNVSVAFGIAIVPMIAVLGSALDFANSQQIQAKFQTAADNAALAAAASELDDEQGIKKIVSDYLTRNGVMKGKYTKPKITVTQLADDKLKVTIKADVFTNLLKVVGRDIIPVKAETIIAREFGNIDVALVLDNTGSMYGRKLSTLKQASTDLINTVYNAKSKTSKVRMALVPFSNYVNVGLQYRNASWATNTQDKTYTYRKRVRVRQVKKRYACKTYRRYYWFEGRRRSYTYQRCKYKYGRWVWQWRTYTSRQKWYGCMASRQNPWDTRDERYGIKIPGVLNRSCGRTLTPLTENKNSLLSEVRGMGASGATYIPAGLAWGWRVVSEIAPFANSNGLRKGDTSKAIVLMTDGENTRSARYSSKDHEGSSQAAADKVTAQLCRNIKASNEKITIYAVAFEVSDQRTRAMLRNCASSPSHYYDAKNSVALTKAFKKIAKSLANLRIAQ